MVRTCWMRDRRQTYYAQTSCVANGRSKLSISYPLHTTLNNGHCTCQLLAFYLVLVKLPLMPRALVSSVLKGILAVDRTGEIFGVGCVNESCTFAPD
jgi:hypothetical protein